MIDPVSCALTTSGLPDASTKRASTSSAVFPNETFSSPPMAGPARRARCSVARLIDSASGTTAAVAAANVHNEVGVVTVASATEMGTRRSSQVNMFSSPYRTERSVICVMTVVICASLNQGQPIGNRRRLCGRVDM
jgi:hypothetical protein